MRAPDTFRRVIGLLLCVVPVLLGRVGELSANVVESVAEAGLPPGTTTVDTGTPVTIYSVELTGQLVGVGSWDLVSITITISDIVPATGLLAGDFTQLNLVRSLDGVLDGGDVVIGTQPVVNVGAGTTISPAVAETFVDLMVRTYFITAEMAPGTEGKSFKVGAAGGDITIQIPAGPQARGTGFAALDANRVLVDSPPASPPGSGGSGQEGFGGDDEPIDVPLGGTWLIVLGVIAAGLWAIRPGGPDPEDGAVHADVERS